MRLARAGFAFLFGAAFSLSGCATLQKAVDASMASLPPDRSEIVSGLKEALRTGTGKSIGTLSQKDGFWGSSAHKILFPPEALEAERRLRQLGFSKLCDDAILSFNRAAEAAVPLARTIFVGAITRMTFADAMTILRGKNHEATDYFKAQTATELTRAFRPHVRDSLAKVDATRYWDQATAAYNKIPLSKPIQTDLTGYVTERALTALFANIASFEASIRAHPMERTSDLLRRVFGYADTLR